MRKLVTEVVSERRGVRCKRIGERVDFEIYAPPFPGSRGTGDVKFHGSVWSDLSMRWSAFDDDTVHMPSPAHLQELFECLKRAYVMAGKLLETKL